MRHESITTFQRGKSYEHGGFILTNVCRRRLKWFDRRKDISFFVNSNGKICDSYLKNEKTIAGQFCTSLIHEKATPLWKRKFSSPATMTQQRRLQLRWPKLWNCTNHTLFSGLRGTLRLLYLCKHKEMAGRKANLIKKGGRLWNKCPFFRVYFLERNGWTKFVDLKGLCFEK